VLGDDLMAGASTYFDMTIYGLMAVVSTYFGMSNVCLGGHSNSM
jgi:hypothetical protein